MGKKSKKRRKQEEKIKNAQEENFKLDLGDQRFSAVFENADFNIEPSNPNFKKTQSMQDMVEEKQRRIKKHKKVKKNSATLNLEKNDHTSNNTQSMSNQKISSNELTSDINRLVNSVQRKSNDKSKRKHKVM